jgi:hypothetical protein
MYFVIFVLEFYTLRNWTKLQFKQTLSFAGATVAKEVTTR